MHILLLVLKIIGIVLLVLLGLLAVLILSVLFVPIRYEARGSYIAKEPQLRVKVTYAFPLVLVRVGYDGKLYAYLRVLGIKLKDFLAPPKEKKQKGKKTGRGKGKSAKRDTARDLTADGSDSDGLTDGENPQEKTERTLAAGKKSGKERSEKTERASDEAPNEEKEKREKVSPDELAWGIKEKASTLIDKCRKAKDSAEEKKKLVMEYMEVLQREDTKRAFATGKKTIFKLLRRIRPRKLSLWLHVGTGDPASLGEICGFYGMLYPFIGKYVTIEPDFENSIYEGRFYVKGKVCGASLAAAGLTVLLHKDLKCLRDMVLKK